MKGFQIILAALALLALSNSLASAYDPAPLQDFCIALNDTKYGVFVNGKFCKDPKLVTADDFFFSGISTPRNTDTLVGSVVTPAFVNEFPALNTLGIALARIDVSPYDGLNPPHFHPRASEILFVQEGALLVGFVSSNQDGNHLFTKVLRKGDIFAFPLDLIHFQLNIGNIPVVAIASLSNQFPGVIIVANTIFGPNPPINPDVLAKVFMLDKVVVQNLQSKF